MKETDNLSQKEINILLENRLEKESTTFMFALAKRLTDKNNIQEALSVLEWINNRDDSFKYTSGNKLKHQKAILLSHNSIKDWDGAIDILRSLYHSCNYHLEEPEILTLLASNYKRKALDGSKNKDEVDMNLLTSALCLYEDSYNLKPNNKKHYDAINMAYLYNIVDAIESEYADKTEIEILYKKLSEIWEVDTTQWWDVCTNAEFLMLLGEVDLAIEKMDEFFKFYGKTINPFAIEDVLFRQLRLYIKFTDDEGAKRFLGYLVGEWKKLIKKNFLINFSSYS